MRSNPGQKEDVAVERSLILLVKIRNVLDPTDFTLNEVRFELGAIGPSPLRSHDSIQINVPAAMRLLLKNGYIQKDSGGHYSITSAGMDFEFETE